jgi:hypothetical protein
MFGRKLAMAMAMATVAALALDTGTASQDAVASAAKASSLAGVSVHPSPSHFTAGRVDNEWFPLRPGNRLVYRGTEDATKLRDVFLVTHRTKVIDGVTCRVVHDRVFVNGILREVTTDWYAQTQDGTVWYFGERTALLSKKGHVVSREGSFRSGRDGAQAGIFMPANPKVGQSFKQEDYPGHAEDTFTILDLSAHISVPVIASDHALLTKETTPLEPGVLDHKYYVRDIGTVREVTVTGGNESLKLVSVTHVG